MRIWSVGHGARPAEELVALLREAGIATLVDIRTAPYSRRHPQFNGEALAATLRDAGIAYEHRKGLGGWRKAPPSSPHAALKEPGFRGYADHLVHPDLLRDLAWLEAHAREHPTAFMCSETLWWKCHRRILADRLVANGWEVLHLIRPGQPAEAHRLWSLARLDGQGRLIYDQGEPVLFKDVE